MVKIKYFFVIVFCFFCGQVFSLNIHTKVSKNPVALNENFNLIIEIISKDSIDIEQPELPKTLSPFILRGTNTSTHITQSFSSPGGASQEVKKSFYYTLYCDQEGIWSLDPISISIDGRDYQTQKMSVEVSAKVKPSPNKGSPSNPLFNQPFSMFDFFKEPQFPSMDESSPDDLKLKIFAKTKKIFLGEMFPLHWFLYRKRNTPFSFVVEDIQALQPEGFWLEKLKQPSQLDFKQTEEIQGQSYLKALIMSYALFPLKTGVLNVDSLSVRLQVRSLRSFFPRAEGRVLKSSPIKVQVSPLPQLGKGVFTGAVGQFLIQSELDQKDILKSDMLSYKIYFKGTGGVHNIELPSWPKDSDFEVYEVLESQKFSIKESVKTFEILLLAKKSGRLKTPAFVWTTFDPQLKSYVSHELAQHTVIVNNVVSKAHPIESSQKFFNQKKSDLSSKQDKKNIWKEKFYVHYEKYQVLFFTLISIIFVILAWKFRRLFFKKRRKMLQKILLEGCQQAMVYKNRGQNRRAGVVLLQVIDQVWEALTGVRGRDVSVLLRKSPPSVRKEFGCKISNLIQKLEFLSFAPTEADHLSDEEVERIIKECEFLVQEVLRYYKQ